MRRVALSRDVAGTVYGTALPPGRRQFDLANEGTEYPVPITTWAELIASFDNDASTYASYDTLDVSAQNGTVTTWPDGIGALDLTPEGTPVHDSTPGEIVFDGTDDVLDRAVTFGGDWGLAIRFRCDAGADVSPITLHDEAEVEGGRMGLYIPPDRSYVRGIARSDALSDNNRDVTIALGTGYHVAFLTFDGTDLRVRVDDEAPATLAIPGAATLTRLSVGVLRHAASSFYFHDGGISHVAFVNGRVWTTQNEDDMVAFLGAL